MLFLLHSRLDAFFHLIVCCMNAFCLIQRFLPSGFKYILYATILLYVFWGYVSPCLHHCLGFAIYTDVPNSGRQISIDKCIFRWRSFRKVAVVPILFIPISPFIIFPIKFFFWKFNILTFFVHFLHIFLCGFIRQCYYETIWIYDVY